MKKVKEPIMTAEEKASVINKQVIKGTGKLHISSFYARLQYANVLFRKGKAND